MIFLLNSLDYNKGTYFLNAVDAVDADFLIFLFRKVQHPTSAY